MRHFENWLEAYIRYTSPLEAPTVFHYWTGISTLAGALRRKVWFDQKFFIWSPNFYIVLVAPPGVAAKSSTANIGKRLLRQVKGIHFGPNALTWQALVKDLGAAQELYRMTDEDALLDAEFLEMSCVTVVADELGSLLNPNDREMVDILTDLWDSRLDSWRKATATMGNDEITNPWVNIIACVTPAWLTGHIPRHMLDAGFFSRIVFVHADQKRHPEAYPGDRPVAHDHNELEKHLVEDLCEIGELRGRFTLTPGAREYGIKWYADHTRRVNENDPKLVRLGTYVSRRQTHLHKIAMVLSAAKKSNLTITEEDLRDADKHLAEVERYMHHVYSLAGSEKNIANTNELLAVVRREKHIRRDLCFREVCMRMGWSEFNEAATDAMMASRITLNNGVFHYVEED